MTPRAAFDAAVKKLGVRGLARVAGVSATHVSRIASGKAPLPTSGKLADYLGIIEVVTVRVKR